MEQPLLKNADGVNDITLSNKHLIRVISILYK